MPESGTKDNTQDNLTPLGQYYLVKKIAQGGMAEIYKGLAYDIHGMKRTVVIKKILPHLAANKEFVDMLVNEAKIAVQLNHGNIAQIYDLGRVGQDYFMVMEFVDGKSLSHIHKKCVKSGDLIPLQYICHIISEVASGLDHMHKKADKTGKSLGIVHRDISPQNIIISKSGIAKIIDFGIAKAVSKMDETESGILKGKFAYMSPEQARGEEIDSRSDIFSLGVILYETISGRRLFKDKDNKATIRNVRRSEISPPSTYNRNIPPDIDKIVMKALAKEKINRYQNAGDMRDDLLKFLHAKFPDFQPAEITEFTASLFGEDMNELEEEPEQTPHLIVDQTQSAINATAPHIMKEFMLEEVLASEKIQEEGAVPEIGKDAESGKEDGVVGRWLNSCSTVVQRLLKRGVPIVARYLFIIAITAVVAGTAYAGWRLGWWSAWSNFFRSIEITSPDDKLKLPEKFTTLAINSVPAGATIFVDDAMTKYKTPATLADIKADDKTHTIGIFLEGYKYFTAAFTAKPDETINTSPTLEPAYGELQIISEPTEAKVALNNEPAGTTPFTKEKMAPGTIIKISVEKNGYSSLEESIKIAPNKASVLRVTLMRLPKKPGESTVPVPKLPAAPEEAVQPEKPVEQQPPQKSTATLTEIPLLPAAPAAPLPEGAPTPESRETPLELDYPK